MYIDESEKKWDLFHQDKARRVKYPDESVIRFIKTNFKEGSRDILDLGCGTGRHTVFMAHEGHRVSAYDFSEESLTATKEFLAVQGLEANVCKGSVVRLPYENDSFDGVVCFGVLIYLLADDLRSSILEMYRVLKNNGKAFIVVRGRDDLRYGMGEEVEPHTFMIENNSTNEKGYMMHFFDVNEIYEWFKRFSKIDIGFVKHNMYALDEYNSDLLITVTK